MTYLSILLSICILSITLQHVSMRALKNTDELQKLLLEAKPGSIVEPKSSSWYILIHPLTIPSWVTLKGVKIIQPKNNTAIYMSDNSELELSSLRGPVIDSARGVVLDYNASKKDNIGLVHVKGTNIKITNVDIKGGNTGIYVNCEEPYVNGEFNYITNCNIQSISFYKWYYKYMYKALFWFLRIAIIYH